MIVSNYETSDIEMKFVKSVYCLDRQVLSDLGETWDNLEAANYASEGAYHCTHII
jgi:hypothetical protein